MGEKDSGHDAEHLPATPGPVCGGPAPEPHAPARPVQLDVDGLVSTFLEELDTFPAVEAGAGDTASDFQPAADSGRESADREMHREIALRAKMEPTLSAAPPQSAVGTESEPRLGEFAAHPRLSVIPTIVARETAGTQPADVSAANAPSAPKVPVTPPRQGQEPRTGRAGRPGIRAMRKVPTSAEEEEAEERIATLIALASRAESLRARRRIAIGLAVIILAACGLVVVIYLLRTPPPLNETDKAASVAAPAGVPPSTATQHASAPNLPVKDKKAAAIVSAPAPARAAAPQSTAKTLRQAAGDDSVRRKTAPPVQYVTPQPKALEANATNPPKQPTVADAEPQGGNVTAAPPAGRSSELVRDSVSSKPVEPPPAEASPDAPSTEAPKIPAIVPPPVGAPATTNPAEEESPKANAPAPKGGPAPLATPAEPLVRAAPIYPQAAERLRITGTVDVHVTVDEQGTVAKATAVSGELLLRPAAEEALRKWKFKPATLRGVNVASEFTISVRFVR